MMGTGEITFYRKPRNFLAISLLLLFVTCVLFGWQWAGLCDRRSVVWPLNVYPQLAWPTGMTIVLAVTGLFTKPSAGLHEWVNRLLESDARMFFAVTGATSIALLLLVHTAVLTEAMLAIGVIFLARFDLRRLRIRGWRQFAVLSGVSLIGFLGGGWLYWSWTQVEWLGLG
ncbi:MAG: hypothetical protein HC771_19405 [Synechococcales cyanobacterium CRU_2_2]|nr:hypothetical protein [Synechococcales cyanobacterium CRU_2_2]